MKKIIIYYLLFMMLLISSCTTLVPTFSHTEDLGRIKVGDSKSVVDQKLGISHYNLDNYDKNGYTAIYYYRVDERRVSSFVQPQKKNGKPVKNDFYILEITFDNNDRLVKYDTQEVDKVGIKKFSIQNPIKRIGLPIIVTITLLMAFGL
jgi:hypothetical protein